MPRTRIAAVDLRRRFERLAPFIVMIGVLLAAILVITPWPVGAYEDDAIYTLLAKALATGDGYRMINLPGSPHATHYPPGYPLLLSVLWRIWPDFPDNVVVFKFANAILLSIAAAGVYLFARLRLGWSALGSAAVAWLGTASLTVLYLAGLVLSEPLYLVVLFAALLATERSVDDGSIRSAVIAGALLGALTMVRTIGVVAIGAAVLILLLRRQWRAVAAMVFAAGCFLLPWQLWVGAHEGEVATILAGKYGSYSSWLADGYREGGVEFARAVAQRNLIGMANDLAYAVMPANVRWPLLLGLAAVVPLVLGGLVVLVRRAPVLVTYFVLYLLLITIWPFAPQRFLLAMWPIIILAAASAMVWLWRWRPAGIARTGRSVALGAAIVLVGGHVAYNWRGYAEQSWAELQSRQGLSARPLVEWVARYTSPDDVLSTEHDVVVFLYTGRRGIPTSTFLASQRVRPFTPDEVTHWMETMITTYHPRYLVTGWQPHITAAESLSSRKAPVLRRLGYIPQHVVFERVAP
jgi:hypothetical protein